MFVEKVVAGEKPCLVANRHLAETNRTRCTRSSLQQLSIDRYKFKVANGRLVGSFGGGGIMNPRQDSNETRQTKADHRKKGKSQ